MQVSKMVVCLFVCDVHTNDNVFNHQNVQCVKESDVYKCDGWFNR